MTANMMRAMALRAPGEPLLLEERPLPRPKTAEILIRVRACGVCRTDLHLADGDLPGARYPVVPGHQIVGEIREVGPGLGAGLVGARVGVTWLASACGSCSYCAEGRENLCDAARFTGCDVDGGFADHVIARADFCQAIPPGLDEVEAAPLLCAGAIGRRTLRLAGEGARRVGLYGFGAAAHLVAQMALAEGREVYAFSREGDEAAQDLARSLGAAWAGASTEEPPLKLDAALVFAPVGELVPKALGDLAKGGIVVCGGIHMSDIPGFPYRLLWEERQIRSVANLTRADAREVLDLAARTDLRPRVARYALEDANRALDDLRRGRLDGAAVLEIAPGAP